MSKKVDVKNSPIECPSDPAKRESWQVLNKVWWEDNPMRYDWKELIGFKAGTKEYFDEIDKRFFASIREFLPWKKIPFDNFINFASLRDQDVLEIGVGHGSHAQLIAPYCKSYTGIDLTEIACHMTAERLSGQNIKANILQMDAERMSFNNESFDAIWSWGVIHHSSDTSAIVKQAHRVLRPKGRAVVMVYYRSFWHYWVGCFFIRGIVLGQLFKGATLDTILNQSTDGAIARFYKVNEWKELTRPYFKIRNVFVCGQKSDVFLLPGGPIKKWIMKQAPNSITRFLTNTLRMGSFLVVEMEKK